MLEELNDPTAVDVEVRMEPESEAYLVSGGGDAQGGNGRDLLVAPGPLEKDGRTSSRPPSSSDERRHQKSGLVQKDEPSPQPCGFFLMRGQVVLIHPWILSSSRSTARC